MKGRDPFLPSNMWPVGRAMVPVSALPYIPHSIQRFTNLNKKKKTQYSIPRYKYIDRSNYRLMDNRITRAHGTHARTRIPSAPQLH